jgi:hypothetical protein
MNIVKNETGMSFTKPLEVIFLSEPGSKNELEG